MRIYDYSCTYGNGEYSTVMMKLSDVNDQQMARIRNLTSRGDEIKIERDDSCDDWISNLKSYIRSDAEMTAARYGISKIELTPRVKVKKVIFNKPATIVFWSDGTKTVVKCGKNDTYDKEKGFYIACTKKFFGNDYKAVDRMNKALEMAVVQTKEEK